MPIGKTPPITDKAFGYNKQTPLKQRLTQLQKKIKKPLFNWQGLADNERQTIQFCPVRF